MATSDSDSRAFEAWVWLAAATGAALVTFGAAYLIRRRNPVRSVNRLLRRCEQRIHDLESAVIGIESTLLPDGD